jgi:hypothetical protein
VSPFCCFIPAIQVSPTNAEAARNTQPSLLVPKVLPAAVAYCGLIIATILLDFAPHKAALTAIGRAITRLAVEPATSTPGATGVYTCYGWHAHAPAGTQRNREEGITDLRDCARRHHSSAEHETVIQTAGEGRSTKTARAPEEAGRQLWAGQSEVRG